MTIKWTEGGTVKLVVLYGRYECLRNPFHPDFNKQLCRYKAYKQIVDCMNIPGLTVCDCVKRISFVKKQYCYELSKIGAAISCGKFYKPKASWFEMMHELLFPYIQSCDCNEEFKKESACCSQEEDEGDGDRCDEDSEVTGDCEYPPCEEPDTDSENLCDYSPKEYHRSKTRGSDYRDRSKSPRGKDCASSQTEMRHRRMSPLGSRYGKASTQTRYKNAKISTCDKGNNIKASKSCTKWAQMYKRCNDAGIRTSGVCVAQYAAQTEKKHCRNAFTSCDIAEMDQCEQSNVGCATEDFSMDTDEKGRRKHHDEFDMFGKSIACQLRSLCLESAVNLEKRIQDMMTEERLCGIKDSTGTDSSKLQECVCTCSDCKESSKEDICTCGLPVSKCLPPIAIKASHCCGFCCK